MPFALALEVDGAGSHPAAWRRAAHAPDDLLTPARVRAVAEQAENAGFTLITLDDELSPPGTGPDPVGRIGSSERAAFIAAATSVLSVAPVISTVYAEPFHVSSQLASLDHIAAGRCGWVVGAVAGAAVSSAVASAWGRQPLLDPAGQQQEIRDGLQVVCDLWDSWEDDAVIRDVATSRYLDRDRLHYVDFVGSTYSVKGPAIVPRPPQGRPVVLAADGAQPADRIDVALITGPDLEAVRVAAGRSTAARRFVELEVALDTPSSPAAARLAALGAHGSWPQRGRLRYVGPAAGLVALVRDLAGFADGVRLHPLVLDEELPVLSQFVLPALFVDRTSARPLPGSTLRATLGLPRPVSRFTTDSDLTRESR